MLKDVIISVSIPNGLTCTSSLEFQHTLALIERVSSNWSEKHDHLSQIQLHHRRQAELKIADNDDDLAVH